MIDLLLVAVTLLLLVLLRALDEQQEQTAQRDADALRRLHDVAKQPTRRA